jgi:hypothetical protein
MLSNHKRGRKLWVTTHHSFDARRSSLPSPPSPRTACLDPNEAMAVQPAAAWLAHIRSDLGSNFCDICRDMHGVKTFVNEVANPQGASRIASR